MDVLTGNYYPWLPTVPHSPTPPLVSRTHTPRFLGWDGLNSSRWVVVPHRHLERWTVPASGLNDSGGTVGGFLLLVGGCLLVPRLFPHRHHAPFGGRLAVSTFPADFPGTARRISTTTTTFPLVPVADYGAHSPYRPPPTRFAPCRRADRHHLHGLRMSLTYLHRTFYTTPHHRFGPTADGRCLIRCLERTTQCDTHSYPPTISHGVPALNGTFGQIYAFFAFIYRTDVTGLIHHLPAARRLLEPCSY